VQSLIVFKVSHLGDAVVFLPTLAAVREHFADARLILVTSPVGAEVFAGGDWADEMWTLPLTDLRRLHRSPRQFGRWVQRLRWEEPEITLSAQDQRSNVALLAWLSGARQRLGFRGRSRLDRLYNRPLPFAQQPNVVLDEFMLYREVSGDRENLPRRVPIPVPPGERKTAAQRLAAQGLSDCELVVIHPGAKFAYKLWPRSRFLALAERIRTAGRQVLFLLGPGEGEWKADFEAAGFPVMADLPVKQTCAVLERARLFVGCNSGPMNLAAAMGTPTVVVQGPSPPYWDVYWRDVPHLKIVHDLPCVPCETPWHTPERCSNEERPHACLLGISVDEVWEQVEPLLFQING